MKHRDRRVIPLSPKEAPLEVQLASDTLPDELLIRIMTFLPFRTVVGSFGPANKMFLRTTNVDWFCANVRQLTVVPSMAFPTIADGLAHAATTRELWLLPGVYRDSIRVTKNIAISGVGKLGSVVVEAPGWNDAIYFAGLGMDGEYVNPKTPDTGELADISNLVFRAPNPEQGFIAHIVRGTPRIHHCELQGGIWISGCRPKITSNTIQGSRSCGVKITDNAAPELANNVILNNKFGGVKMKRSNPVLARNIISHNQSYGMVITTDSRPALFGNEIKDQPDQPKFNPLSGVYGPLQVPQVCGFCGSSWILRDTFGDVEKLARVTRKGSEQKIPPQAQPPSIPIEMDDSKHEPQKYDDTGEGKEAMELKGEWSVAPSTPTARYIINHACWVDPGEISSDDDQLYGDDDIGNL